MTTAKEALSLPLVFIAVCRKKLFILIIISHLVINQSCRQQPLSHLYGVFYFNQSYWDNRSKKWVESYRIDNELHQIKATTGHGHQQLISIFLGKGVENEDEKEYC